MFQLAANSFKTTQIREPTGQTRQESLRAKRLGKIHWMVDCGDLDVAARLENICLSFVDALICDPQVEGLNRFNFNN
jgi:hypothetical protein